MKKMKSKKEWRILVFLALVLISILVINNNLPSKAENPELSRVVFVVSWYDVGEEVLEGLKGVELVNSDYRDFNEINTVWYDPALIDIDEMEDALKAAGTYLGTEKY
jgi:hypothetical protein